jgi:hypothetical protein
MQTSPLGPKLEVGTKKNQKLTVIDHVLAIVGQLLVGVLLTCLLIIASAYPVTR